MAKHLYVATQGGWFSDRSAAYLAMGRPVVAQDTGFSAHVPVGRGLLSFSTPDEAADGVTAVFDDLSAHSRAARELAEEHLDSDLVLGSLVAQLGT